MSAAGAGRKAVDRCDKRGKFSADREEKTVEIRISVRNFVEFLLRSGDIDNRRTANPETAMQEGSRIHRMIQSSMGPEYKAEVAMSHQIDCGDYQVTIEGRADGVISGEITMIDEIKSTYRELQHLKEPEPVHLAQAKCYGYFYAEKMCLPEISVRMTYCNIDTEELKYFHENYTFLELRNWFGELFGEYRKWADFHYEWKRKRQHSIKEMAFPFPYREGQKELVTYVYQTIYHKRKLFIQAPTGVGKTISTMFPAIKAVGEEKADKIFYLTAKTITRTVATNTMEILRGRGLFYKSVVLTAKEKICFMEETECNPQNCPYAKGHFDRINEAIYDLLTKKDNFDRDTVEAFARKHQVCPFEMALDMSLFSDMIICDYNYVFDPYAYLRRFFAEGIKGPYLFLMDEAHNLVERGREMYSASLKKEAFLEMKKVVKPYSAVMARQMEKCNKELLGLKKECEGAAVLESCGSFTMALSRLHTTISKYLEDHDDSPVRKEILEFYFDISRFLDVSEVLDDNYVIYTQLLSDGSFLIREYCVDPSKRLRECMERGISSILFSATFLPIQYYKNLLGGTEADYEVYARSTFDSKKRKIVIGNQVTSKYTRRNAEEYDRIALYIHEMIKAKEGNYLVFFPSHLFLEQVYLAYLLRYEEEQVTCLIQSEHMSESDREEFLSKFETESQGTLLGFCVLGGIFSEGIDLAKDRLIGAMIVGTGLPQVCFERELLKEYFERQGKNGFDYAYRYPGMNKVLQAAGRVIRTTEDVGMVALLDERFLDLSYLKMFPVEWEHFEIVTVSNCQHVLKKFWDFFNPA